MTAGGPWGFLPPPFRKSLDRLGFAKPTPVQSACLPKALSGESFRAVAPTGTGKTLVYLLPAWQRVGRGAACSLILLPTRELAYQVSQMLQALEPSLRDEVALAIGGHPKESQLRRIREGWRILVATPGRLLEMLDEKSVSLKHVTLTVLDEFDKLIGMGFEDQIAAILERVPADGQKLLLSATDQDAPAPEGGAEAPEDRAPAGSDKLKKGAGAVVKISAAAKAMGLSALPLIPVDREAGSRSMEEAFFFLKSNKKKGELLLLELGGAKGQAIVFVANRDKANHLNGLLRHKGIGARVLHGHLPQEERADAYQAFRGGGFRVLVATDLASRGLDMPEVDLIVNFDLPKHYKDYVHRTGRTARRGRAGRCVSFAGPDEYLPMRNLEKEFPGALPVHPAFAQRDRWFLDAKRNHDHLVKQEERKAHIRREQGLEN
ncbi:MAG TPA: DEAD/DEAH box helicase [Fibrobacteria bacterium]|nr:DEAD/DEAH box helicase [Fibrobacteria bacterium]